MAHYSRKTEIVATVPPMGTARFVAVCRPSSDVPQTIIAQSSAMACNRSGGFTTGDVQAIVQMQPAIPLREISREQAKRDIRSLFVGGEILYISDIAERLRLPAEQVVDVCLELLREGDLTRRDDTKCPADESRSQR